ncbi:MAG: hypothetical protein L0Y72_05675 [Gemmataceae bacterium]|nr:hypothetical protein [Gemmataceae bacterium]MCI0738514.1 hypothetical protein [Gemmataceae bacterium]
MSKSPDSICREYAAKKVKITIRPLPGDDETLLIEGDKNSLEFLGKLLMAQAQSEDCGFQMTPHGAGKAYFSKDFTRGVYIHRTHPAAMKNQRSQNSKTRKELTK